MTVPDVTPGEDRDVAGASADRERDRRKAKDRAATKAKYGGGMVGDIAVALSPERQSTRAWGTGAIGEREVGAALDRLTSASIRVLHDRRIPRSKANIDHIVVTPSGVWVIDTKRYVDKRVERRAEGGLFSPRVQKLYVRGSDKTLLVDGMLKQVGHVREAVGEVPITGVLCFVDADWSLFAESFTVNGVQVMWPKKLITLLKRGAEPVVDVDAVFEVLNRTFVRA